MDYVNGWIEYVDPTAPNPKTPTSFASNIPVRYDGGPVDLEVGTDGAPVLPSTAWGGGVFKIQYTAAAQGPSITQQPASQTVERRPAGHVHGRGDEHAAAVVPVAEGWTTARRPGPTSRAQRRQAFAISSTTAADNGDLFRCMVSNSAGSNRVQRRHADRDDSGASAERHVHQDPRPPAGVEASVNKQPARVDERA